jgi:phosphoglucomutase
LRYDFDAIDTAVADKLMADLEEGLPALKGKVFDKYVVSDAYPFVYNDPVDKSSTKNGIVVCFSDGSRIMYRLSGTGTSGATLRVYIENYEKYKTSEETANILTPLANIAMKIAQIKERTGKEKADVIT